MQLNLRKVMAESNIKKIKKQLEEIDTLNAQSQLQPMECADDTYLIRTHEDQKQKLLKELKKNQKILDNKA
jgi:cytidylate kinase